MSFNLVELEKKITDRLSAAPLASQIQSAYNTVAPSDTVLGPGNLPLIVFQLASAEESGAWADGSAESTVEATYDVAVIDSRENGFDNLMTAFGSVYGDAQENGLSPTYGLHLWEVTGMTGIANCRLQADGMRTEHDSDNLVYIRSFRVFATEA